MKLIVLPLLAAALVACGHSTVQQQRTPASTARMSYSQAPAACGSRAEADDILRRVNAVRAAGYRCGARSMGPAGSLKWNSALHSAAAGLIVGGGGPVPSATSGGGPRGS